MDRQAKLYRITTLLSRLSVQAAILNANGEYSINIHAENILAQVLNAVYGWDLVNVNYHGKNRNHAAIDLADTGRRIAVQVTSTPDLSKVLKTIGTFKEYQLYKQYDRLYIYIITRKLKQYNQEKINNATGDAFSFSGVCIIDHTDIYLELNKQNDLAVISHVLTCLEKEFQDQIHNGREEAYTGLPDLPVVYMPPAPFISLRSYTQKEAAIFWGRNRQIKDLYDACLDEHSNPVILLYGQTGVGKSSLLDAGLLPRLRLRAKIYHKARLAHQGLLKTLFEAFGYRGEDVQDFYVYRHPLST